MAYIEVAVIAYNSGLEDGNYLRSTSVCGAGPVTCEMADGKMYCGVMLSQASGDG